MQKYWQDMSLANMHTFKLLLTGLMALSFAASQATPAQCQDCCEILCGPSFGPGQVFVGGNCESAGEGGTVVDVCECDNGVTNIVISPAVCDF